MVSVPVEREGVCNINIQNFQRAANADSYSDAQGRRLAEDGKDGPNTQYVQAAFYNRRVGRRYGTLKLTHRILVKGKRTKSKRGCSSSFLY